MTYDFTDQQFIIERKHIFDKIMPFISKASIDQLDSFRHFLGKGERIGSKIVWKYPDGKEIDRHSQDYVPWDLRKKNV